MLITTDGGPLVQPLLRGRNDAFVAKLAADGAALVYATYLGGNGSDGASGIAVDATGAAYVTGVTGSSDFPTTPGAFQPMLRGGDDAFVAKLAVDGASLVYATYLGSSGGDFASSIALDATGAAWVTGSTNADDFPTTAGALQATQPGGEDDGFVAKLAPNGTTLAYATYLGGSHNDGASGIAVDATGAAYVTGSTASADFPRTPGNVPYRPQGTNAFVVKLGPDAKPLYATFLGGTGGDNALGIAVDATGAAYVTGPTESPDFPITPGAFQPVVGGPGDAFVAKLAADGASLVYATYLGGTSIDIAFGIAVDATGAAHVTGSTTSLDFPTSPGAFQTVFGGGELDAFIVKIE